MSIDTISSSIRSYGATAVNANTANGAASPFAPAAAARASSTAAASGSTQSLSSDLRSLLLQLQSGGSGGGVSEAGNPTQAAPGMPHHSPHAHGHGHNQQAAAKQPVAAG